MNKNIYYGKNIFDKSLCDYNLKKKNFIFVEEKDISLNTRVHICITISTFI